jgi:hypothetical protein
VVGGLPERGGINPRVFLGSSSADMTGWTLSDEANHTYTLSGTDTATDLYWESGSTIWNNTGDTAYLRDDQGTLIDTYAYWYGFTRNVVSPCPDCLVATLADSPGGLPDLYLAKSQSIATTPWGRSHPATA